MSTKELPNKPAPFPKNGTKASSTEEAIIQGLTLQQSWKERPEISALAATILRLSRLSPLDAEEEWRLELQELDTVVNNAKLSAARKVTTLQSRREDCAFLHDQKLLLKEAIEKTREHIEDAKLQLVAAKKNRKNREEYERMANEVSKRSSISEITVAKETELKQKLLAEEEADRLQRRIEYRQRQAAVVLQAADDFRKALLEPVPGIDL